MKRSKLPYAYANKNLVVAVGTNKNTNISNEIGDMFCFELSWKSSRKAAN